MNEKANISDIMLRTRTKEELEIRKEEFLKICQILDDLEIRYFLQTGILLGAIRHKGFIPWDWDIEISVFTNEIIYKTDTVISKIKDSGFTIIKNYKEPTSYKIDFKGKLSEDTTYYTIWGWTHDIEKNFFWRDLDQIRKLKFPDHFVKNMQKIKLFDRYHLAPFPADKYLEYQYGDWKKIVKSIHQKDYLAKEFSGINTYTNFFKRIIKIIKKRLWMSKKY
ncbi:LicD family protein [Candidatus Pelagibacter sp.]|nr:LicD family protein [Candidatus Pelagibacter sp.]